MVTEPELLTLSEQQQPVQVWRWERAVTMLSSAPVGGGVTTAEWLVNIEVPRTYTRTDLHAHVAEVASAAGLSGPGAGLFTAANVREAGRAESGDVVAHATVGISKPTWAADPSGGYTRWYPGTINIVVQLPLVLAMSAAVNTVITATEAKTQALIEAGVTGTGTASDAIVITWPAHDSASEPEVEPVQFGGPRSPWGSRVAGAVHEAVAMGIARWND